MIHPASFESKIGFDIIRKNLLQLCLCEAGEIYIAKISAQYDAELINHLLQQTEEMHRILLMEQGFPSSEYIDLSDLLLRIRPEDSIILEEELLDLRVSLRTLSEFVQFFTPERSISYPLLAALCEELFDTTNLVGKMGWLIDDKGKIKDKASPELFRIRQDMLRLQMQSREKLTSIISHAKRSGWAPPDLDITVRNGRLVIPLFASHKRKIKGFVHDASATEQTVFLEPEEVLDINNEVKELEFKEKDEIRRILLNFTAEVRPHIPQLSEAYQIMGQFDGIRAKALYAMEMDGVKPKVRNGSFLDWQGAKHPLLLINHKEQGKEVVPFSLSLNDEQRILVISGPNAGGKSVCLKSIGLLQYMIQCGMLVPMKASSESGVFKDLFIDIGDEQSIENDLSTYSYHLMNMLFFLENSNSSTLFLIDEFGSGTEPQAGGAIAETCLGLLRERKAIGAVTTHYANLKLMAENSSGIVNGAMMFDTKQMKPLYKLVIGRPGTSFAFEIARKIGFPEDVLKTAVNKAGHSQYDFELQIQRLEEERISNEKKQTELRVADSFLTEMIEKYERLNSSLEKQKNDIIRKAKEEARTIIEDSNRLIEKTIREIRESEASRALVKKLRHKIEEKRVELGGEQKRSIKKPTPENKTSHPDHILEGPVQVGDDVRIAGQKTLAQVLKIQGSQAEITTGSIVMRVGLDKLERIKPRDKKKESAQDPAMRRIAEELRARMNAFTPFIDIRGMRVEEARSKMEAFVDEAILLNIKELRVLHGKGDGILRQWLRDYLASRNESIRFRDEHADRGGHGITIIQLNQ